MIDSMKCFSCKKITWKEDKYCCDAYPDGIDYISVPDDDKKPCAKNVYYEHDEEY